MDAVSDQDDPWRKPDFQSLGAARAAEARTRPNSSAMSNFGQILLTRFNVGSKSERSAGKAEREKVEKRGGKKTRPVRQTRRSLDQ